MLNPAEASRDYLDLAERLAAVTAERDAWRVAATTAAGISSEAMAEKHALAARLYAVGAALRTVTDPAASDEARRAAWDSLYRAAFPDQPEEQR